MTLRFNRKAIVFCGVALGSAAQGQAYVPLPDAPGFAAQDKSGTATVSGVVVDSTGAAVTNATITLARTAGLPARTGKPGSHGDFTFDGLSAGEFELNVTAPGFISFTSTRFTLAEGQAYSSPRIQLIVGFNTEVNVSANAAEAEVRQESKQRLIGLIPNYYVVYSPNPVPLTGRLKFRLALLDSFDPAGFVGAAIGAGIEQAGNTLPGYGDDTRSYFKRYAQVYGDGLTSDMLSHAVLPVLFHQDPRYYYQGSGTRTSRFKHAVKFTVVAHSDSGKLMPNYSYVLGAVGSGALSNLYYPHEDRGVGRVFINGGLVIGGLAVSNLVQEFILPYFTTHSPSFGKKKPAP